MSNNSGSSPADTSKYRPYLTIRQIQKILSTLKGNPEPEDSELISSLELLIFKANQGLSKPSYTPAPSWAQKLEMATPNKRKYTLNERVNLYVKWKHLHATDPSKHFSPDEIAVINEYRYTSSLMSDTEELEYTNSLMPAFSASAPDSNHNEE